MALTSSGPRSTAIRRTTTGCLAIFCSELEAFCSRSLSSPGFRGRYLDSLLTRLRNPRRRRQAQLQPQLQPRSTSVMLLVSNFRDLHQHLRTHPGWAGTDSCGSLGDLPPISEDCQKIFDSITISDGSIGASHIVPHSRLRLSGSHYQHPPSMFSPTTSSNSPSVPAAYSLKTSAPRPSLTVGTHWHVLETLS